MKKLSFKQQVKSGFLTAGAWLLGLAWLFVVFAGMIELGVGTELDFSEGHHPSRALGYLLLAIAAAIFVVTANRWKRAFPGIMVASTLGALLEVEHGHILNNSSVLIPRSIALVQLVVIAGVAGLSFAFKTRPLNLVDRAALLVFTASIYLGGKEVLQGKVPIALIVGGICVLTAWAIDRFRPKSSRVFPASNA